MDIIKELIITKRPGLSKQSIKTYTSILKNLYIKVFGDGEVDVRKFDEARRILEHLKSLEPNKRKTILSALVITTDNKLYREQMLEDINEYNKETHKQEKTEDQKESWVDGAQIKEVLENMFKEVKLLYKKENKTMDDLQCIQQFVILCLLGGVYIPPRRSKDYVDFKISNINKLEDNYMEKGCLVFNSYKTSKTYGQQKVVIPPELKAILTKWIKINPTEYLLFDGKKNQLTNVKLNQRLNKMFGDKKVGVNQLRHTFLSDKYQETIKLNNDMAQDMRDMGSSRGQEKVYIKRDYKDI